MIFNTLGNLICGEEAPSFLGIFDFSTAPPFLFYSYIPIVIASALIGFYIYIKDRKSLLSKLLLWMAIFFILWVLNILVQWVSSYHTILMFGWQLTAIFEVGLFLLTVYLAYVFVNKKDLPAAGKLILWVLGMVVVVLTSTKLNISSYDLYNCEGVVGPLWSAIYIFEPAVIVAIIYLGFNAFRKESDKLLRRQTAIFTIGLAFFLTTFFLSNFYGELTKVYEFNLWGPIGMLIFFVLLGYMIVKFQTFHLKVFATQALIVSIWFLVLGILFIKQIQGVRVVTILTLILVTISGGLLIRSVRKEIEQKEQLAKLIQQRESLMHLINHKVKGAFTRSKYIFAGILDGTFGLASDDVKARARQGLDSDDSGIKTVDLVLNVANLEKGNFKYDMRTVDFREIVNQSIADKRGPIEAKGIKFETDLREGEYKVTGDAFWLKEVVNNFIDNAGKYTHTGSVTVRLEKLDNPAKDGASKIRFSVKDTGVGLSEEDKKNLFTEGGRGKDAVKINPDSTGYGLYSVKLIADAHGGRVWAESDGAGQGSTFFVELNAI